MNKADQLEIQCNEDVKNVAKESRFRSLLFKMVHMIALGLPVVVIWLAQPGSSKCFNNQDCHNPGCTYICTYTYMLYRTVMAYDIYIGSGTC